jgi:hypothetical protein
MRNSPVRISTAPGSTKRSSFGVATVRPSIALNTEIAGVTKPSPKNSAAPNKPTALTGAHSFQLVLAVDSRVLNASTPPSPRLSARKTMPTYLMEMTSTSDHTISDSRPRMLVSLTARPCAGLKHSRKAYSGLVPMSPNTTPNATRTILRSEPLRSAAGESDERRLMGCSCYRWLKALGATVGAGF